MQCAECCQYYHLGKCAGVSEQAYKKKNIEARKTLRCPVCRLSKSRTDERQLSGSPSPILAQHLAEISKALVALTAKVDDLSSLKQTVTSIEASVQHMSDTYDQLLLTSERHEKEIDDIRKRVDEIEKKQDAEDIGKLKLELNDMERYSRCQNMEIRGLSLSANENLLEKVNDLANQLDLPCLTESDIEGLHRLSARPDTVPPVLIRFAKRLTKTNWMAKRAGLKDGVYFVDNLTVLNKKLLWLAKSAAKEKRYEFVWTKEGKVYVRKEAGAKAIRIGCEEDLAKLV